MGISFKGLGVDCYAELTCLPATDYLITVPMPNPTSFRRSLLSLDLGSIEPHQPDNDMS